MGGNLGKKQSGKTVCYLAAIWLLCGMPFMLLAQSMLYKNASLPAHQRVDDLIQRMTLDEKIGQMLQLCASSITLNGTKELDLDSAKIKQYITRYHAGSFLSGTGNAARWVKFINQMQGIAMKETRLGIPVIFGIDHVHGANYVDEGTFFPHQLTLSCSFDTSLIADVARITAKETAMLGLPWNFAPVLDVGKNPFWPRHYETFGEDPLLCAALGRTYIKTYQNESAYTPYRLAACAKHFIGYSDPKSGWDRAPSEIPLQVIQEQFIPPFRAAIDAGVKTLMVNSGELNGEPVHGSRYWLTDVLRGQLGFEGVVVTDIKDIVKMVTMHHSSMDETDATFRALNAGIDVHMACDATTFTGIVKALIEKGKISEARLDSSVRRILKLKFDLGLFENPYASYQAFPENDRREHLKKAVEVAAKSIVLLKNSDKILPLNKGKRLLVAGFAANAKKPLTGPWTLEWQGAEEARQPADMLTLAGALKQQYGATQVQVLQTADTIQPADMESLAAMAMNSDVIVLTIGEKPYSEFKGNDMSLALEATQQALVNTAYATGKPVVLVLIEGRPRIIRHVEPKATAILFAGYPGSGGGEAIARMLSGQFNPSGKLSFSYPFDQGHWVPYYHKPAETAHLATGAALWQYPFGHGLSYTSFTYGSLQASDTVVSKNGSPIEIKMVVRNTGLLAGDETVLMYITDETGWITRPVKQLKGFSKIQLLAGESGTATFTLRSEDLMYPDASGLPQWEPGFITIEIGGKKLRIKAV